MSDAEKRAFARGVIYVCAEALRDGHRSFAEMVLRSAGLDSIEAIGAVGADSFDVDRIRPIVSSGGAP